MVRDGEGEGEGTGWGGVESSYGWKDVETGRVGAKPKKKPSDKHATWRPYVSKIGVVVIISSRVFNQ